MDSADQPRLHKVLRRQRQSLNCEPCRKKKCRCDRQLPCDKCLRSRNERCTYATVPVPETSASISSGSIYNNNTTTTSTSATSATERTNSPSGDKTRSTPGEWQISTLVNYLVQPPASKSDGSGDNATFPEIYGYGVEDAIQRPSQVPEMMEKIEKPVRNIMVKSRYLSPSSWIYCCMIVRGI